MKYFENKTLIFCVICLVATILLLTGCGVTGTYFVGDRYAYKKLVLNGDSTFVYEQFFDAGGLSAIKGKWAQKKDILILNSFEQPGYKPNSVHDTILPNRDKKIIMVCNMEASAHNWVISINNGQETDTLDIYGTSLDNNGLPLDGTYSRVDSIHSIKIIKTAGWSDCILRDSTFYPDNPASNVITIYAQPYNLYYGVSYLVNAAWKRKRNKIYTWRKENGDYSPSSYLKRRIA